MQSNPRNNVALPVVPFYVSRAITGQLCGIGTFRYRKAAQDPVDDDRLIAR
jgi:hypothetical protein